MSFHGFGHGRRGRAWQRPWSRGTPWARRRALAVVRRRNPERARPPSARAFERRSPASPGTPTLPLFATGASQTPAKTWPRASGHATYGYIAREASSRGIVEVFATGRGQAACAPKEYRLSCEEALIERRGEQTLPTPRASSWRGCSARAPRLTDDYADGIEDSSQHERRGL